MQASAPTTLIRCALQGDRFPEDLLMKLIRRSGVDEQKKLDGTWMRYAIFAPNTRSDASPLAGLKAKQFKSWD